MLDKQSNSSEDNPDTKYGLVGMLNVIRPTDADRNLAVGCDLTSLGLNLNSSEYVL